MANWCRKDPGDAIADGEVLSQGNFSQLLPDTPIMVGKPLTITGGNWSNVRQDPAWTVTGGNWTQVSRCYHLHPELETEGLAVEVADCPHVVSTDTITLDEQVIDTIYHYQDTVL